MAPQKPSGTPSYILNVRSLITEKRSQKFYKPLDVHSVTNAIDEVGVSMIFLVVTFFVGRWKIN